MDESVVISADLTAAEADAVREALAEAEKEAQQRREMALSAIQAAVLRHRDEAVRGRQASGIEDIWLEDEEMYEGIDDANRHEEGYNRSRQFELSRTGGPSAAPAPQQQTRSTVLLNIARRYADAFSARVGDMLMPTDDRAFSIAETPEAEGETGDQAQDEQAKQVEKAGAEAEQEWIDDRLVECDWHGHIRQVIDDAARCGSGVIKGPVPANRRRMKWVDDPVLGRRLTVSIDIEPESKHISFWDFFPDPGCGQNIHRGSYVCERERWTAKTLSDLVGVDGWETAAIEACLKEGPAGHTNVGNDLERDQTLTAEQRQFEVWHWYGTIDRQTLEASGCDCGDTGESMIVPIMAVLCNDRLIKVAVNVLDTGVFPYDVLPASVRAGMPWGRGKVREVRTPQRIITGAIRNLMDNNALSAGVLLFLKRMGIEPMDGRWELTPRKMFWITDETEAEKAVRAIEIPSRQIELMNTIDFALRMAEDVSGMPMLMQGQTGGRAPDTVGVATIQNNNANAVLRRLAKLFDTRITEPHIRRYHDWAQQNGPKRLHGNFKIDARGSSALVERDIQNQGVLAMANFVNDPEYRINKPKWFAEWSKSQRLDPKRFQYTDDEWKEVQANQQPQKPYQIEVAEIRAKSAAEVEAARGESRVLAEQVRAAGYQEAEVVKLLGEEKLTAQEIKTRLLEILTKDRRERDLFVAQRAVKERFGESVDMPG